MTGTEIMAVVVFILTLFGAVSGVWWRIESKHAATDLKTQKVAEDLSAHKLHVAETYVSKQGLREAVEPIMDAIQGVKGAVDHLGGRIDGIYHAGATPRPRTPRQ